MWDCSFNGQARGLEAVWVVGVYLKCLSYNFTWQFGLLPEHKWA